MMKSVRSWSVCAGAALVSVSACIPTAHAQILLTVDTTNITAVRIAATSAASAATSAGGVDSIRLDGFFPQSGTSFGAVAPGSTLRSAQGNAVYGLGTRSPPNASLLFSVTSGFLQSFIAGEQAFTGSFTGNFIWATMRPMGYVGDIYIVGSANAPPVNIVIGQYQIIPAPTTAITAAAMGLLSLTATARRRRR